MQRIGALVSDGMRVLIIDIETRPNLAYVWRLFDENVGLEQLLEPTEMISFAAKWKGEPKSKTVFYSVFHDGFEEMVRAAFALLEEADVVIHYNGKRFDVPHLNSVFVKVIGKPVSPFQQIDLYQAVKHTFKFPSNKLDYVARALGVGRKVKHTGFDLWKRCLEGDPAAWALMRRYNIGDVVITERVHDVIRPWIPQYPSFAAFTGTDVCPKCGSKEYRREGHAYTRTGRYQRYQCLNKKCGAWFRATRRDQGTHVTEVAA